MQQTLTTEFLFLDSMQQYIAYKLTNHGNTAS
jgi:hypothetical protein